MEGFVTCLLQSICLTGHDAFWSCQQRSWRLSSIRTSCLHASICFWEVWRDLSKHMYRDWMRELQILTDFALTCASNSCRVPFHKSEANNLHITFQPNNPGWLLLKSFSWLPTGCLTHKASGSLHSATHNPIARSQDAQTSSRWTSESSCWWGRSSQHSWHAGILLGLIEAVHWERGSLNGCLLFQASTCIVKFMHIVYATVLWYTHDVKNIYRYTFTCFTLLFCWDKLAWWCTL